MTNTLHPGERVGNVRILRILGSGGMGTVFEGFDERLQRGVAVKALHPDRRVDERRRARLVREAQTLSRLAHPNICGIHEIAEHGGGDVLILELVNGRTLGAMALDELEEEHRLRIAIQLADALSAAHALGVVHRDLKPENIMLTSDGDVKVLDFGLSLEAAVGSPPDANPSGQGDPRDAPAADPAEASTAVGTVVGTLAWMSPEQVGGERATPASDVYSLGLVLQTLLGGPCPYPDRATSPALLVRVAQGRTQPMDGGPPELVALVERMKSLEPDLRPSAVDVAERLRWIRSEPERVRRRRRRNALAATAVLVAIGTTVLGIRAEQSARRARIEAATAEEVTRFLVDLFRGADPERSGEVDSRPSRDVPVGMLLDRGADRLALELRDQPAVRSRLLRTIGEIQLNLGAAESARPLLEEAAAVAAELEGDVGRDGLLDAQNALANLERTMARYDEAAKLQRRVLELRRERGDPDHPDMAIAWYGLGSIELRAGDFEAAGKNLEKAAAIFEAHDDPERLGAALNSLGIVLRESGRLDEAARTCRRALRLKRETLGADHPSTARTMNTLANLLVDLEELDEALELYEESLAIKVLVLGEGHPSVAVAQTNLGRALVLSGRPAEALPILRGALATKRTSRGDDHPTVAATRDHLGLAFEALGDTAAAETEYRAALEIREAALGPDHPETAESREALEGLLRKLGEEKTPAPAEGAPARVPTVGP